VDPRVKLHVADTSMISSGSSGEGCQGNHIAPKDRDCAMGLKNAVYS